MKIITNSVDETLRLGVNLGKKLSRGDIVCFYGDLGSGKTTFIKGIAKELKVNPNHVNSPTFVLLNIYEGKMPIYHFDLYRIDDSSQMQSIGYDEFIDADGISLIEWSEKLEGYIPREYLKIQISHKGESKRMIQVDAVGKKYKKYLEHIKLQKV